MASKRANQIRNACTIVKYSMTLDFYIESPLEAKMYSNSFNRYAVWVDDHEVEFWKVILVKLIDIWIIMESFA